MQRRSFLNTLTAGLVAGPPAVEDEHWRPTPEYSPTEKVYREGLLENIKGYFEGLANAPSGDLVLLDEILNEYEPHVTTERTSRLCWSIDINLTQYSIARVKVNGHIQGQVEAVADVLEALHEKRPRGLYSSTGLSQEGEAILGAVAVFLYAANEEQVAAFGKGVSRHFARLQA